MSNDPHNAPTLYMLMAQYGGRTVVPIDQVCYDFFGHLTPEKLLRKALRGDIVLPIVRIETSQKAQRGVHLVDLAAYIDKRRAAAVKDAAADRTDISSPAVRRPTVDGHTWPRIWRRG